VKLFYVASKRIIETVHRSKPITYSNSLQSVTKRDLSLKKLFSIKNSPNVKNVINCEMNLVPSKRVIETVYRSKLII
jgi:hypothetical protein